MSFNFHYFNHGIIKQFLPKMKIFLFKSSENITLLFDENIYFFQIEKLSHKNVYDLYRQSHIKVAGNVYKIFIMYNKSVFKIYEAAYSVS